MLRLIVNADDGGYSASRDAGIVACVDAGAVTSVSVLVNGASAPGALRALAARAPRVSVGLHLNLTEGRPVCPPERVPSLLAPPARAVFRGKAGFRAAVAAGEVRGDELAAECAAQTARFVALHPAGAPPTHVDGHQHVQSLPAVAAAMAAAMTAAAPGAATRLPRLHAAERDGVSALPPPRRAFYEAIDASCADAARAFAAAGVRAPPAFLGFTTMGGECDAERTAVLLRAVRRDAAAELGAGRDVWVEWMVHPGRHGGGDDAAGCGDGADDFSMDAARAHEAAVLCSPALADALRREGAVLATYADFAASAEPPPAGPVGGPTVASDGSTPVATTCGGA